MMVKLLKNNNPIQKIYRKLMYTVTSKSSFHCFHCQPNSVERINTIILEHESSIK